MPTRAQKIPVSQLYVNGGKQVAWSGSGLISLVFQLNPSAKNSLETFGLAGESVNGQTLSGYGEFQCFVQTFALSGVLLAYVTVPIFVGKLKVFFSPTQVLQENFATSINLERTKIPLGYQAVVVSFISPDWFTFNMLANNAWLTVLEE